MKNFIKVLAALALFAATLAAAVYYLERKGILSIEYSSEGSPFKLREIDLDESKKNIFRSKDYANREKLNEQIEQNEEKLKSSFDFEFANNNE